MLTRTLSTAGANEWAGDTAIFNWPPAPTGIATSTRSPERNSSLFMSCSRGGCVTAATGKNVSRGRTTHPRAVNAINGVGGENWRGYTAEVREAGFRTEAEADA